MGRIHRIEKKKTLKARCVADGISAALCLVLLFIANISLPKVIRTIDTDPTAVYGSMILRSSVMGYVVISVFAFLLGVFVTLLCYHLREIKRT